MTIPAFDPKEFAKTIRPIPPAKDVWLKATVYGDSGVGKTRLAASRRQGKVLFANIENGYLSIAGSGINKVDLETYKHFQDLFLYLKTQDHGFDTLWVDSFTEAQRFVVAEVARDKVGRRESKDPYKLSLEDYGLATERLRQWVWDLRSLPMHVFYVCLAQGVVAKGEIVVKQTIATTAKLAASLYAYSDLVAYYNIEEAVVQETQQKVEVRRLHLQPTGDFVAKARMPVGTSMPTSLVNPTLDKIIGLYRGETKPKEGTA